MNKLTDKQLLRLIEAIASSDFVQDLTQEIEFGTLVPHTLKKLETCNKLFSKIYRYIHGHSKCQHKDWQKEAVEEYNEYKKQNLL